MRRYRRVFIGLCLGLFLLNVPLVPTAHAQTTAAADAAVLRQIVTLLQEVARLQALLNQVQAVPAPRVEASRFFNVKNETVYQVRDMQLVPLSGTTRVRTVDQQLFDLFAGVVGEAAVRERVRQWQVFNDEMLDIGAFVEVSIPAMEWIVGVNRYGFRPQDQRSVDSFVDLFVHEYAHMVLYDIPQVTEHFAERFWTRADYRHSERVLALRSEARFPVMESYYQEHRERFVSDYATMNVDEDLAESFTMFVVSPRPTGSSVREQKISFFYAYPELVAVRGELRKNLETLPF